MLMLCCHTRTSAEGWRRPVGRVAVVVLLTRDAGARAAGSRRQVATRHAAVLAHVRLQLVGVRGVDGRRLQARTGYR